MHVIWFFTAGWRVENLILLLFNVLLPLNKAETSKIDRRMLNLLPNDEVYNSVTPNYLQVILVRFVVLQRSCASSEIALKVPWTSIKLIRPWLVNKTWRLIIVICRGNENSESKKRVVLYWRRSYWGSLKDYENKWTCKQSMMMNKRRYNPCCISFVEVS